MIPDMQSVSTETALRLVADRRRRLIIQHLSVADSVTAFDELVDGIAAEEPLPADGRNHAERIATDLLHVHLPKLAEANVVEYDSRTADVRYRPHDRLEKLLRFVVEELE